MKALVCLVLLACAFPITAPPQQGDDPDAWAYRSPHVWMTRRALSSIDSAWQDGWEKRIEFALCAPAGWYTITKDWTGQEVVKIARWDWPRHVVFRDSTKIRTANNVLMCPIDAMAVHSHFFKTWNGQPVEYWQPSDVDSATARRMLPSVHLLMTDRFVFIPYKVPRSGAP